MKAEHITLIFILLIGVCLRAWGLSFGLHYAEARPDELQIIGKAMGYGSGDFNPHFFNYPSLFSYILFACYGVLSLVLLLFNAVPSLSDIPVYFAENIGIFVIIARSLSVITGAATIVMVYLLAKSKLGQVCGVLSALLMAVCYLHVRESHFGVTDTSMTFAVIAVNLFAIRIFDSGKMRSYIEGGILVGLATSLKYNGALSCLCIVAAHLGLDAEQRKQGLKTLFDRRLILAGLAAILAFFLTSPFVFLDWRSFLRDFLFEVDHLGGAGESLAGRGWWYHLRVSIFYGAGLPLLLLSVIGGYGLIRRMGFRVASLFLVFPVIYYVLIGKGFTVLVRYILPVLPYLCILGAFGIVFLAGHIKRNGLRVTAITILLVAAILPNLYRSLHLVRALSNDDTRALIGHYLEETVTSGSSIGWIGTMYGKPLMQPSAEALMLQRTESMKKGDEGRLLLAKAKLAEKASFVLDFVSIDKKAIEMRTIDHEYVVTEYYPTPYPVKALGDAEEVLKALAFIVVAEFSGASREVLSAGDMVYDFQDSFYLPLSHPERVTRPGPTFTLWQKGGEECP